MINSPIKTLIGRIILQCHSAFNVNKTAIFTIPIAPHSQQSVALSECRTAWFSSIPQHENTPLGELHLLNELMKRNEKQFDLDSKYKKMS